MGRPGGDISRADKVLVKGEQGFVDFEDVIIAPPDEVFHDDIELAGMGHGVAGFAQKIAHFPHGQFQRQAEGDGDGLLSWHALTGMTLVDATSGAAVGTIDEVDDTTVNLLFSVRRAEGDTVYVPAHEDLITDIDTAARTVTMTIPEGLLD